MGRCGPVLLRLRVSVLIPAAHGACSVYSVYSVVWIRDARAALRLCASASSCLCVNPSDAEAVQRCFQHRDPEAQRHGGRRTEEVTTEYTEYTERGATALCL